MELVIVPRENEAELLTLPAAVLTRLVIVAADDVRTYLKDATEPHSAKPSQEQREAIEAVSKLREAQVRLELGRVMEAQEILGKLAGAPRELYTMHRLLELLQAQYASEGKMLEASLLRRQLDDAMTRRALQAGSSDFDVPVKGDTEGQVYDPPPKSPPKKNSSQPNPHR